MANEEARESEPAGAEPRSPVQDALPENPAPGLVVPLGFEPCLLLTRLELRLFV
jgi:hypothetical protein